MLLKTLIDKSDNKTTNWKNIMRWGKQNGKRKRRKGKKRKEKKEAKGKKRSFSRNVYLYVIFFFFSQLISSLFDVCFNIFFRLTDRIEQAKLILKFFEYWPINIALDLLLLSLCHLKRFLFLLLIFSFFCFCCSLSLLLL